ncbi:MAG TPA: C25 family cysteine peptidase, partial [Thermoanaerobaculia bacterium]
HGSVEIWSAGSFGGSGVSSLTNGERLPVVVSMTCLNTYFHDLYTTSFSERLLLNPNGGAVASWSSSGLTPPLGQRQIAAEFHRQIFAGATLGEAAMRSTPKTSDGHVRRTWVLLGDPSMRLRQGVTEPSCTSPSIGSQPESTSIVSGNSTTLQVSASGDGPFTYQWYAGTSGNTSNPVGANSASLSVSPMATTRYWVRVTGQCGPAADSNHATVTVTAACVPSSISSHPQGGVIVSGDSATLHVVASGDGPFTYQWYVGTSGNTSNPIGSNSASLSVSPSATTSYWVRVTGQCGPAADSAAAIVSVCTLPRIVRTSSPQPVFSGSTVTLSAEATGSATLQYVWYEGALNDTSSPVGYSATITRTITTSTRFWVRVVNACGEARSEEISVMVVPAKGRSAR